jgi:uncharacterized membrane protein YidH (DUF202 family)
VIEPPEDDGPAGAEARTDLAWSRSGLAIVAAAAAILKIVINIGDYRAPVAVLGLLIAGAVAWVFTIANGHYVAGPALAGQRQSSQAKVRFVAVVTTLFAAGALVISFLPSR